MKRLLRLNIALLSALGRVLDMTNTELMEATGIKNATWYRIMGNPNEITVQQLISIANGLSIPVRRFFSYDDSDVVGGKGGYVENPYKPCTYYSENLLNLINTQSTSTWQDVASKLGLSRSNLRNSLLSVTRLPLGRFLKACDLFGIDPFCVIVDPNPLRVNPREQENALTTAPEASALQSYLAAIQNELTDLRTEILMARHDIVRVEKKIDMIIDAHYEDIVAPGDEKPTAELTKQTVKEILSREDKQLSNNEVLSLPAL